LGTATFSSALNAAQVIYRNFDRHFPEGLLDGWSSTGSANQGLDSIDVSNRYLTPSKDVSGLESIPFHKGVDPRNILLNMAGSEYIHTDDNYVGYFSMHRDADGQRKSVKKFGKDN